MLTQLVRPVDTAAGNDPADPRPRRQRWPWGRGWAEAAIALASSSVLFLIGFGGGLGRLSTPLGGGDLLPAYAAGYLWSQGSPYGNSSLGFPFGMQLPYYPTGDHLLNLVAGAVTWATGNPFLGMNFVFAASFPGTALAALWVLGIAGIRGPFRMLAALSLTFIPYHWFRLDHIYLGTMYSAVLGVGLALLVGSGAVERRLREGRKHRVILLGLLLAVVIAASGIYYACFTILLCAAALLYRAARGADWRSLALASCPAVVVALALGAVLAPATVYVMQNPPLDPVAARLPVESVIYSGALAFTLLPAPVSRIPGFGAVNDLVSGVYADAQVAPTAGVLWYADFGSVLTCVAVAVFAIGGFLLVRRSTRVHAADIRGYSDGPAAPAVTLGLIGLLLVTAVLFFIPWGLNYLFAELVTPQLRGWDRMVPVLFMLLFVGTGIVVQRLGIRPRPAMTAGIVALALFVLLFDSVLPYRAHFTGASSNGRTFGDAGYAYAEEVNRAVPGQCGVLQLPYVAYPEQPPKVGVSAYEQLWPALTNPDKAWSFGAMYGTKAAAWQRGLGDDVEASDVPALEAAGFCAVHVDTRGYVPDEARRVTTELEELFGEPVASGFGGQWMTYELPSPVEEGPDARELTGASGELGTFFAPPRIVPGAEFDVRSVTVAPNPTWWLRDGNTRFDVDSIEDGPDFTRMTGDLESGECDAHEVVVSLRSGNQTVSQSVQLDRGERAGFSLELDEPTQEAELLLATDGDVCEAGAVLLADPRAAG